MCDYIDKWKKEKGKMHRVGIVLCNSSEMSNSDSDNRSRMRNAKIFQKGAFFLKKNFFCSHNTENDITDPVEAFKNVVN